MKPLKVLLVEDNDADVELTRETLEGSRLDVELSVACDGIEAIDFLRGQSAAPYSDAPDLILLDLNLPRVDGREVLVTIKADHRLKTIPVVVLTSSDAESDIVSSYRLGANCYITKPNDFSAYQRVVEALEGFWFSVVKLPTSAARLDG
jgi:two-component system response regulator